jgi:hypothetical protein
MIERGVLVELMARREASNDKESWNNLIDDMVNGNLLYYLKHLDKYRLPVVIRERDKNQKLIFKSVSNMMMCGICSRDDCRFNKAGLCSGCEEKICDFCSREDCKCVPRKMCNKCRKIQDGKGCEVCLIGENCRCDVIIHCSACKERYSGKCCEDENCYFKMLHQIDLFPSFESI